MTEMRSSHGPALANRRVKMTSDQADFVISYIDALSNNSNHRAVMSQLEREGYTEKEIDDALKALGSLAGRDCGIL